MTDIHTPMLQAGCNLCVCGLTEDDPIHGIKSEPAPLTDDHLAALKDGHACLACPQCAVLRLVATVGQARSERDALRLRFAGLIEGVLSFAEAETNAIIAAGLRAMVEDDDDIRDHLSPAEVAALRRAQTPQEETSHD